MPDCQASTFSADFLSAIQKDLSALQAVVTKCAPSSYLLTRSSPHRDLQLFIASPDQWSGAADMDAIQAEHTSLSSLQVLLKQCIEAFAFLVLLIDHQLSNVLSTYAP
jgi:hypothetical protein